MKNIDWYYQHGNVHYFFLDFTGKGKREIAIWYESIKRMSRNHYVASGTILPKMFKNCELRKTDIKVYVSACVFDENKTPKYFEGENPTRTMRDSYIKWRDEDMTKAIIYRDFFFDMDFHLPNDFEGNLFDEYRKFKADNLRLWDILQKYNLKFRAMSSGKGMHFVIDGEFMKDTGYNFNQRNYDFYKKFYDTFKKKNNFGFMCDTVSSCADQLMKMPYSISSGNICLPIRNTEQLEQNMFKFISYDALEFSPRDRGVLWQNDKIDNNQQKENFFKLLKDIKCRFSKDDKIKKEIMILKNPETKELSFENFECTGGLMLNDDL